MLHLAPHVFPRRARSRAIGALAGAIVLLADAGPAGSQVFTPVSIPDMTAHVSFSTGGAWVDFDGDGDLDLYVLTAFGATLDNVLYRNDGNDQFVRVTGHPLGQDGAQSVCSTWADFDNDGAIDAYVSGLDVSHGLLFQGAPAGAMTPNTATVLSGAAVKGAGCAWGDYDNDGYVDLVVSVLSGVLGMSGGNRLFHNKRDGTFEEVTGVPPTASARFHHHVTWADFDGDGDLDLFFATGAVGSLGTDDMYVNQWVESGIATFVALNTGVLATDLRDSQTLSWADIDNDGDLDCYAINYTSVPNQLYRNDGGGTFTKLTSGAIVTDMGASHGVAWGDFDNDGDLDVVVARDSNQPNRYYRNEGNGTFTSITTGAFVTTARSNYGVAAADYDGDGDLDLFVPTARSEGPSVLYRNDLATGAHWLEVKCTGSIANRSAIGAKVRVLATIAGAPRWQMREISAGTGYGSQGMLTAHFGLGDAASADSLVVEWPGGRVDRFGPHAADVAISVVQATPPLAVGPDATPAPARLARVVPNPVGPRGRVEFTLARPGMAGATILDLQGRTVARPFAGWFGAGEQSASFDPAILPGGGVYLARVVTPGGVSVCRFVHIQ